MALLSAQGSHEMKVECFARVVMCIVAILIGALRPLQKGGNVWTSLSE